MSTATENPQVKPKVDDIEKSIDGFFVRVARAWKTWLILAVVFSIGYFFIAPNISGWMQYILYGLLMLFQLMFAVLFMIVQFVALFWFLGRPRMYWILPGETGVGFKDYKGNP